LLTTISTNTGLSLPGIHLRIYKDIPPYITLQRRKD
jgi:hypothetical protein